MPCLLPLVYTESSSCAVCPTTTLRSDHSVSFWPLFLEYLFDNVLLYPVLSGNGAFIGGSHIGSKVEVLEMLKVAADKGVKSWIEVLNMSEAGKAVQNVYDNKVRYRHVLK
jgi:hypothetical protein